MLRRILDLCGGTGAWSEPYRKAGYDVYLIEIKQGKDVRLQELPNDVHGVLAAPPCTHLAGSGARWWEGKGEPALLESLSIVDACLRIVCMTQPSWWALENPVGRLVHYLGEPRLIFNPCDYGDPYTKATCLWGRFTPPTLNRVEPTEGSKMWAQYGGKSEATKEARSVTPPGFARAFFEANP